jgi:HSP20 family protein
MSQMDILFMQKEETMSNLIRWDPFNDRLSLRDAIDRLFEDSFVRPSIAGVAPSVASLAMDVIETKDNVIVKSALPGVKPDQVEITVQGDTLTIRGEMQEAHDVKEQDYIRKERRYGSFSRSVTLPSGLKSDKAEATFENGVLTLKIPKSEEVKPKTIKVKAK